MFLRRLACRAAHGAEPRARKEAITHDDDDDDDGLRWIQPTTIPKLRAFDFSCSPTEQLSGTRGGGHETLVIAAFISLLLLPSASRLGGMKTNPSFAAGRHFFKRGTT